MGKDNLQNQLTSLIDKLAFFPVSDSVSMLGNIEKRLQKHRLPTEQIKEHLGVAEGTKAIEVSNIFAEAVLIARTKSAQHSLPLFEKGNSEMQNLEGDTYLYAQLFCLSGWAYYYHLTQQYHKAISSILEGLCVSEYLEEKGYKMLTLRRLGDQVANLARVFIKQKRIKEASKLYRGTIRGLLYNDFSGLFGKWDYENFDADKYLRQKMIDYSVCDAIKCFITFADTHSEAELFEDFFDGIEEFETNNNHLKVIYNFLYLKRLFYKKNYNEFLENLAEFLNTSLDNSFDIFKFSFCVNLLEITNFQLGGEVKNIYKEKIGDYIRNHLHLGKSEKFLIPIIFQKYHLTQYSINGMIDKKILVAA